MNGGGPRFGRGQLSHALVLSGGFLRSAFQIEVIEVLHAIGVRFDLVIGVSSGAWNAACLAAGQVAEMRRWWIEVGSAPKFSLASLLRYGTPLDFSAIVERTAAQGLRFDRLAKGPTRLLIGRTRLRDWSFHLFDSGETVRDFLRVVMASNYLPGIYGAPISIEGRYHADRDLIDNVPYKAAFRLGASKVIVVVPDPDGVLRKNRFSFRPHRVDPAVGKRLAIIHPYRLLWVGRLLANAQAILEAIEVGREAARGHLARYLAVPRQN